MTDTPRSVPAGNTGTARARLIQAGLDIFGNHGYTAATTRMIAEQGQTNLAAIPYHFGGKEGLYLAVIDHIVETVSSQLSPHLQAIQNRLEHGTIDRSQASGMLERLLGVLIDFVVGSAEAPRFSRIILREQMSPSNAFERIYTGIMEPLLSSVTALLTVIAGEEVSSRTLQLRAFSGVGQIMAFRFGRETVSRYARLNGYSPEETLEIRCIILKQTLAALEGLYPQVEKG